MNSIGRNRWNRRGRLRPLLLGACLLLGAVPPPSAAGGRTPDAAPLRFAGEEWPPFVTSSLPSHGLSGAFLGAVFERAGHEVQVDYYPWKRAMELGLHDPRYAGLLAVWRTPEREKLCHFSSSIGSTLNVLAFLKEAPVQAAALAELESVRVGTVAGYSNGEQFDTLVREGRLKVEEGVNDEINLRKLLTRRFPAIVIEKRVLRHLLAGGQFSKADRARVAFSDQLFKERPVHVCFKRTDEGLRLQKAFNDAAREVDLARSERDYWRRIGDDALPLPLN
jgi:polar amino acid transport system substrate-binding protein